MIFVVNCIVHEYSLQSDRRLYVAGWNLALLARYFAVVTTGWVGATKYGSVEPSFVASFSSQKACRWKVQ